MVEQVAKALFVRTIESATSERPRARDTARTAPPPCASLRDIVLKRLFACALCAVAASACGDSPSEGDRTPQTITGSERLGWNQSADGAAEISTFRFAIYVDGVRSDLPDASCRAGSSGREFSCSAALPAMSSGAHTLELATLSSDGGAESARSSPLRVNVVPAGTRSASRAGSESSAPESTSTPAWQTRTPIVTRDGLQFRLEQIAANLVDPTDLAFAPDGRLFVAQRDGRILVVRNGRLLAQPALLPGDADAGQLLAIAVDPQFEQTRFVYTLYTSPSRGGTQMFGIARFREVSDSLADRVVVRDEIAATSSTPSASLRIGADGKLFAAFDDGGVSRLAGDLASANGKLLRMNPDGTTPEDQEGGSPLFSYEYHSPRGFDWHPSAQTLWIADRDVPDSSRLSVVANSSRLRKRGVLRAAFRLPQGTLASSVAFYWGGSNAAMRDNLLVASEEGRHLLRIRLDPQEPTRVVATERLLQDAVGGVRTVAVSPDGAIYVGTADAIGRLALQ
jgi:glucose/arabinose dehydrogenase